MLGVEGVEEVQEERWGQQRQGVEEGPLDSSQTEVPPCKLGEDVVAALHNLRSCLRV